MGLSIMVDKLDEEAYLKQLASFDKNEMAQWTCYHEAKEYGDANAVGEAMRNAFEIRQQRAEFCAQAQAATAQPQRQQYVSDEQRAARQPHELDCQDLANMMNESKYKGRGFTAQDYYDLRRGLGPYQAARGRERK
jgi:hypothetical protein